MSHINDTLQNNYYVPDIYTQINEMLCGPGLSGVPVPKNCIQETCAQGLGYAVPWRGKAMDLVASGHLEGGPGLAVPQMYEPNNSFLLSFPSC